MNFWTIGRIQELLGDPDGWPKMRVEDAQADAWLDGYQARYTVVDDPGFAYAWVPGERMARIFAAAPEALAWCVETITTAYALANSYATTNEAQRKRIDELLATVAKTNQRAEAAERDCATVMEQRENWRRSAEAAVQNNAALVTELESQQEIIIRLEGKAALSDLIAQREFINELHFQVSRFANQKEAAQAWGVSESYLSDVLSGWRAPGEKICKAVGYDRVMMYGKVQP